MCPCLIKRGTDRLIWQFYHPKFYTFRGVLSERLGVVLIMIISNIVSHEFNEYSGDARNPTLSQVSNPS